MATKALFTVAATALLFGSHSVAAQTVDLPTSKQLIGEIPGHPQRLNSLPMSMAVSPDGNWLIDSPKFVTPLVKQLETLGGIAHIFLTHRDDVADAERYARSAKAAPPYWRPRYEPVRRQSACHFLPSCRLRGTAPLPYAVQGQAAIATPLCPAAAMSAASLVTSGRPRRIASSKYVAS